MPEQSKPMPPDRSIVRQECGVCGADLGAGENCPQLDEKRHCDGTTIERRYVAVDALLSDEAIQAGALGILGDHGLIHPYGQEYARRYAPEQLAKFAITAAVHALSEDRDA